MNNKKSKNSWGYIINGETFIIKKASEKDVDVLNQYINKLSKEKTFVLFQGEKVSKKDTLKFLERFKSKKGIKDEICLLMFYKKDLIGVSNVGLRKKIFNHIGGVGLSIKKEFRGKGFGKILMSRTIDEAKSLPGIKKLTLGVFGNNKIAISLYKKLGFKEYGYLPKAIKWRGKFVDEILMYKDLKKY